MAVAQTLVNSSFENPTLSDRQWTVRDVPGWQIEILDTSNPRAGAGVENHPDWVYAGASEGGAASTIPDGQNVLYLIDAAVSQTYGVLLAPNTAYTLAVDVGQRLDVRGPDSYSMELWAGERLVAKESSSILPRPGSFEQHQITFETGASYPQVWEPVTVRLAGSGEPIPFAQINFDDVRLTTAPSVGNSHAIDRARSELTLSSAFGGVTAHAQQPGSHVARYSGSLRLDFDPTTKMVRFNGGSVIDAEENPANIAPGPDNTPTPVPADYGLAVSLAPTLTPTLALRDFQFDLNGPAIQATAVSSNLTTTRYEFDSRKLSLFLDGNLDYNAGPFGGRRVYLGEIDVQNQSDTASSVTVTNTAFYTKTEVSLSLDASIASAFTIGSTPLPLETRLEGTIVATTASPTFAPPPVDRFSSRLPAPTEANHLVLIAHGWNSGGEWTSDMADAIGAHLGDSANEWDIVPYDWTDLSNYVPPSTALSNAVQLGTTEGRVLAARNYDHVHLIAHSAGAGLISEIARQINLRSDTTIHATFLGSSAEFVGGTRE